MKAHYKRLFKLFGSTQKIQAESTGTTQSMISRKISGKLENPRPVERLTLLIGIEALKLLTKEERDFVVEKVKAEIGGTG